MTGPRAVNELGGPVIPGNQYIAIFINLSPSVCHLHPLQVENCDSNSRLVVDEMTMVNSGLKGLTQCCFNIYNAKIFLYKPWRPKGFLQFEIIINVLVSSFRFIVKLRPAFKLVIG